MYAGAKDYLKFLRYIDKTIDAAEHQLNKSISNKELFKLMELGKSLIYFSTSLKSNESVLEKLMRGKFLNSTQLEDARQILRDIESLDGHTSFLFNKINFLMDATVGFININQNKIIKIFSVASVAMLPPTLIASVYGMNFQGFFPEIHWEYGYPFSLGLMLFSVAVPFWFFYKKGWLR